jgi:hypothetical protein
MSFQHIKEICEVDAGLPVTDAVITVPEFWTQKVRPSSLFIIMIRIIIQLLFCLK